MCVTGKKRGDECVSLVKKGARVCVTGKERGRECVSLVKRETENVCHC